MFFENEEIIILDSRKMTTYDIDNVCLMLERGQIIVFPTETVYGIACNAWNIQAVKKIYKVKRRNYENPLLLHIGKVGDVYQYIKTLDEVTKKLILNFWPGPLSLVLEKSELIPDYVTSGLKKVGIRCTSHKITQAILTKCKFPVVATSANISGYENCYNIEQISKQLGINVDLYIDDGSLVNNLPSTIVEIENNGMKILREGVIKEEDIWKVLQTRGCGHGKEYCN